MFRLLAVAVVFVAVLPCLASEPGEPLDCSDWVVYAPGLSVTSWHPENAVSRAVLNARAAFDAEGGIVQVQTCNNTDSCGGLCPGGLAAILSKNGQNTVLGCLPSRFGNLPDSWDFPQEDVRNGCLVNGCAVPIPPNIPGPFGSCVGFNQLQGRLYFSFVAWPEYPPHNPYGSGPYPPTIQSCFIDGLATLMDVMQTYVPAPSSVGFRVPYMPEGMAAADHFDTYWGPLPGPIDFAQAHPLQCSYPASPPHVGDYLTVNDPLPNPSAGHGYYYVTAATFQGQTRYGRKASGGRLSGRDPALLPVCAPSWQ